VPRCNVHRYGWVLVSRLTLALAASPAHATDQRPLWLADPQRRLVCVGLVVSRFSYSGRVSISSSFIGAGRTALWASFYSPVPSRIPARYRDCLAPLFIRALTTVPSPRNPRRRRGSGSSPVLCLRTSKFQPRLRQPVARLVIRSYCEDSSVLIYQIKSVQRKEVFWEPEFNDHTKSSN
jgi:hypothetical protein